MIRRFMFLALMLSLQTLASSQSFTDYLVRANKGDTDAMMQLALNYETLMTIL